MSRFISGYRFSIEARLITSVLTILLLALLSACSEGDNRVTEPTLPPTPTEVPISFSGPLLENPSEFGVDASQSECSAESGCVSSSDMIITEAAGAMPLAIETINGVIVGVPAGYSAQVANEEILISAVSLDEEGGFMVVIREVDTSEVAQLSERFNFEAGIPAQNDILEGTFVMRDSSSAIALLTASDGRQLVVDAYSDPGYWLAFDATFREIVRTLML